ncbi:hypothetical protein ACTXT7_017226 [Hymenolepis weldensis]
MCIGPTTSESTDMHAGHLAIDVKKVHTKSLLINQDAKKVCDPTNFWLKQPIMSKFNDINCIECSPKRKQLMESMFNGSDKDFKCPIYGLLIA